MLGDMAFVGRERELAQLAGALQRTAEGRQGHVVLTATAGAGITRLLDELTERMAGVEGLIVARGCAAETGVGEPYQAPVEALSAALAAVPDDRLADVIAASGHDLCVLVPGLAERLDALGIDRWAPELVAPEQLGSRVLESLTGAFERIAGDGVLLLALEELHWADPATRGLIRSLLRIGRPIPVCLVLSYRPEELHRRHPARALTELLSADTRLEHIELGPLSRPDLEALVGALHGERPSGDLLGAVLEGSGGDPLKATQLVVASASLAGVRLSDPFEQVVGARLGALTPGAAGLVRLLAAARQPMKRATLMTTRLSDGRVASTTLTEVVDSGLARETANGLIIAHELYAEAIEALALPTERSGLHASLAAALGAHPARAAWHWEAAARPAEARVAHLAAAAAAQPLDPGETTLLHALRALELTVDVGADPTAIAELLVTAARAAAAAGSFRQAAALTRRAIDARAASPSATIHAVRGPEHRLALGMLHEELGRQLRAGGDLDGGLAAMEHALALMPGGPSRPRAGALASLAQQLMIDGRFAESATRAQEARAMSQLVGPAALEELGHATCTLGVDIAYLGELDRGLALLEEAATTARQAGRLDDLIRVAANRTTLLDLDSRREQALEVVTEGIRDAEAGGLAGTYGAFLRGNAADILFQLGRWEASERECRAGMEWQPAGVAWFSPTLYLGLVLVESRADDEAARLVGQTLLQLDTVPAGQWSALVQRAAVSLALWRGHHADAVAVAAREWPRVLETDDLGQVALAASTCLEAAAAAAEDGDVQRDLSLVASAMELAERVLPEAERLLRASPLAPHLGARVEAELHLATARAHRGRLRGKASAAAWDHVARGWAARSIPFPAAKARWWQALAALQGSGDREGARAALQESWRLADMLPARPLQAALLDLATRARLPIEGLPGVIHVDRHLVGVGPGRQVASPERGAAVGRAIAERLAGTGAAAAPAPFGLSPRELEVLVLLCEGRTDREIGERLFISERTVHVHVRHILAKLEVSSRTQAASLALRQGLVPLVSVRITG